MSWFIGEACTKLAWLCSFPLAGEAVSSERLSDHIDPFLQDDRSDGQVGGGID